MRFTVTLLLIGFIAFSSACNRHNHDRDQTAFNGLTMGTSYNVKLTLPEGTDRETIRQGIAKVLHTVNRRMSTYLDDSELSAVNKARTTDRIPISPELSNLLATALQISWYTNGAFDITVGPLVNLWGFGPVKHKPVIPPRQLIEQALARTGYQKIKLGLVDQHYIQKKEPDLYLDLSGIAKGYGVDQIAAYLDTQGIKNYMIEVGGEIQAKGTNASGSPWRIGVEKPVTDQRAVERIMQLEDQGMATSGDYRNFFMLNGKRYSHIIDPATGYPVSHNLVSVSVLDESTTRADALATALIVMGPDEGYEFATDNRITAMFIIRSGKGFIEKYTGTFKDYLINP